MTTLSFHGDDVIPSNPQDALFHIIPVPLEQTVSYKGGTASAPQAIIDASAQLETLTLGMDGVIPADYGLYTAPAIDCSGEIEAVLQRIETVVGKSTRQGKIPVLLGGEHSLSQGVIAPLKERYGEFGVVQFDAHADLRKSYGGTIYSHASVMRRFHEAGVPLFQLGTRSYSREEQEYRNAHRETICWLDSSELWQNRQNGSEIRLPENFPENIYISFDIDGLDAAVMPATGTPVPGGLQWLQAMDLLAAVCRQGRCIGFDVVEFAPISGQHAWDFTAAQLVYDIMGLIVRGAGLGVQHIKLPE